MTLTALPKRKEHIFMKGRVQPKNGYLYIVISRGKGLTPKWISTGLKDTAANARTAKKMVEPTIEEYKAQFLQEQKKIPTNLAEVITPTIQAALPVPETPLFADTIPLYLAYAKINVRANTYDKYEYAARKHIIPYFKEIDVQIARLTTLDIQGYYSYKMESGLSKESLKYHRTVINQTLQYAIEPMKLIQSNPSTGIRLGKSADPVIRYYDADQLKELFDKISDEGNQIVAPVILAAYYGLRRSEALGMEWMSIDFKRKTVTIQRTAIRTTAGTVYSPTVKSTSSLRTMPLFPEIEAYLKELYRQQKQMQSTLKKAYVKNNEVCKWDDGHLVSPDYVTHRFRKLIEKYDLPPLTFHQLRHSTASLLINNGYSLKEVQEWLGHANPRSTNVYAHMQYKSKENMAKTIGSSLSIPKPALPNAFLDD